MIRKKSAQLILSLLVCLMVSGGFNTAHAFSFSLNFKDPAKPKTDKSKETYAVMLSFGNTIQIPTFVKPSPTFIPSRPTATPTLTQKPPPKADETPKKEITNTQVPTTDTNSSQPGAMNADLLFDMANNHRKNLGLPAFQKDERVCSLARERAPEIAAEFAAGKLHSGMYGRNLPYWNTENAILMGPESAAFNWWINDDIHRRAIEGTATHSCVACTAGNACVQEFTSFQPK